MNYCSQCTLTISHSGGGSLRSTSPAPSSTVHHSADTTGFDHEPVHRSAASALGCPSIDRGIERTDSSLRVSSTRKCWALPIIHDSFIHLCTPINPPTFGLICLCEIAVWYSVDNFTTYTCTCFVRIINVPVSSFQLDRALNYLHALIDH
jgi:hypothetical protein